MSGCDEGVGEQLTVPVPRSGITRSCSPTAEAYRRRWDHATTGGAAGEKLPLGMPFDRANRTSGSTPHGTANPDRFRKRATGVISNPAPPPANRKGNGRRRAEPQRHVFDCPQF